MAPWAFAQEPQTMQQAIQFQHLKDKEDARQAALEARHPSVPAVNTSRAASEWDTSTVTDPGPGPSQLRQAIEWEHHKDAAAAQQAALEARHPSDTRSVGDSSK
jgi:hypothetical protein